MSNEAVIDESQGGSMPEPEANEVNEVVEQTTDDVQQDGEESELPPVPVKSFLKQKASWQAKADDAAQTAEELQRELQAKESELALYKVAQTADQQPETVPDRYDYDSDEAFTEATRDYYSKIAKETAQSELQQHLEAQRQQDLQRQAEEKQQRVFDKHYQAAADFGATDYVDAENNFKRVFGKETAQTIINVLSDYGVNSALAAYHIGKNEDKAVELLKGLSKNPAVGLLAVKDFVDSVNKTQQSTPSTEPDQAETNTGGGVNIDWSAKLKRAEDQLDKGSINMGEFIAIRKQARAQGVKI